MPPMFAALVLERDPLKWQDLPAALQTYVQDLGGLTAAILAIWLVFRLVRRPHSSGEARPVQRLLVGSLLAVGLAAYVLAGAVFVLTRSSEEALALPDAPPSGSQRLVSWGLTLGGACALLAVLVPFLADLPRLRWRRIWALTRLSFMEAIRRRLLWALSGFLLVLLFASWFVDYKPEDQVRTYVQIVYLAMTLLLIVAAALVAAFSLPADIRNQTIHTIVTKPVERFEIILGRFLGYTGLMTLILAVMTTVSLGYMLRQLDPDAKRENARARIPVYGELSYSGTTGDNVGREWDYRRYIAGGPNSPHRAIWTFNELPASLANRTGDVDCEFAFDIFRTTKGEEGKGVFCTFTFTTWRATQRPEVYREELDREKSKAATSRELEAEFAEQKGFFEIRSRQMFDYRTVDLKIPSGFFRNALQGLADKPAGTPTVTVTVKCESPSQYVGMARYDFYLLDSEGFFWTNFFKGMIGLWLRLCIVIGLAVTASTYLSGVISFLVTLLIFLLGYFQNFIKELAEGKAVGGGPMEALVRLVNRENLVTPLDSTPGATAAITSDYGFRWLFRIILDLIPDVDRFTWTGYVAEGFNISGGQIALGVLLMLGYLLPCFVLGYYLIRSREIATW